MDRYFDYAAATPLDSEVLEHMIPYLTTKFHNPSSLYTQAKTVRQALDNSRKSVAQVIGAKPREIIYTSGCTEANNLAIHGVMRRFPGKKLLISTVEHDSISQPASHYAHSVIPVNKQGIVEPEQLNKLIGDDTVLISVVYVNNEMGAVQPLRTMSKLVKQVRQNRGPKGLPLYLHTDAAQAPRIEPIVLASIGVDMMSLSGAKIYGPKGSGCLYLKSNVSLSSLIEGGGQERGLRSGTENVPGAVGFSCALEKVAADYRHESARLAELANLLRSEMSKIGGRIVVSATTSIVSASFPVDSEYLLYQLDARGFAVGQGSACHASSEKPSSVLSALGLEPQVAKHVVRFSLGKYSTPTSVRLLVRELKEILAHP